MSQYTRWPASGAGNVTGPGSSTDNAVARFDGTTGKILQNSVVTISDSGILTLGADGVSALDAVTLQQLQAVQSGVQVKQGVLVATTANITLSGEQTIDGVLTSASRVLVKNQTDAKQNGIYLSAAGAWSRTTDADTGAELEAALVTVEAGTVNSGTGWYQSTPTPTIGVSNIVWFQFFGAGTYSADGLGIILTGNVFSLQLDGATLSKSVSGLKVNSITSAQVSDFTEAAQDAVGAMVDSTLVYVDATPLLTRAALTGDITAAQASNATTLATVNSNVGTFGSATQASVVTVNGKGLTTAASNVTITPAIGSVTGMGTGVSTFLVTPSSANLAAAMTDETGSGALVFANTPTLVTPVIGAATGTSLNLSGLSASTVVQTDGSKNLQSSSVTTTELGYVSGVTSSIQTQLNSKQSTGNFISALTGDVTATGPGSVAATLATVNSNVGSFGSATQASVITVNGKGLITAASNTTVTPAVGSITGLGTGVATFLATPSSANLAAAVTDETGSGALVFANTPTLVTPAIGAATGASLVLSGSLTSNALTSGRVTFAGASGILQDDADMTFATDTLSITKIVNSTSIVGPLHIGGTTTTSSLTLQSTSGVGTTNADIIFKVGNNGATEAARILNSGFFGIGVSPASPLDVLATYTGASGTDLTGANFLATYNTADAAKIKTGIKSISTSTHTTGSILGLIGITGTANHTGNGGTVSVAYGLSAGNTVGTGATITSSAALLAADATGAGTITTNYGLLVNSMTKGATNYAVFTTGTAQSSFGGNVGIATTSPGSALDVKGTIRLSGASSGFVGLAGASAAGSTTYTLPSADGSSGQMLSTNGSATLSWASALKAPDRQVFTANGTWTKPSGFGANAKVFIQCWGAGGGGGGGSGAGGGGGGGAGYAENYVTIASRGSTESITVSSTGGTAGDNTGSNGGTGGNTVFGSLTTANGGAGGQGDTGGAGGGAGGSTTPGSGGLGISGSPGTAGRGGGNAMGGGGGNSSFGGGGAPPAVAGGAGVVGSAPGGGSGGGAGGNAGGVGAAGRCIVTTYDGT